MNLLRNIYKKNFEVPKNVISQIKINFFFLQNVENGIKKSIWPI